MNWKNHIQYLEQLRQVIGLRSYGNRDPLVEYKKEAYSLFENLLNKIKYDLITILINLKVVNNMSEENDKDLKNKKIDPSLIGKKLEETNHKFLVPEKNINIVVDLYKIKNREIIKEISNKII